MHRSRGLLGAAALTLIIATGACEDGTSPGADLTLSFQGLEPLAGGFHYEGWAMLASGPVSTGKFNVASGGGLITTAGAAIPGGTFRPDVDLDGATAIVITIEPAGDTDRVPASTKMLAGNLSGGTAALNIAGAQALATDFATAAGSFILATPTDGPNTNERSGIWFLRPGTPSPTASLTLPTLPAGWRYEGWVVISGRPVTTGAFTMASGADAAAPYSGTQAAPPFPGEDFLRNAPAGLTFPPDLAGGMAVISVEPFPDDAAAPFTLKPLTGAIPANAAAGTNYALARNSAAFPTGTATVR
jgi:hypothetical protein